MAPFNAPSHSALAASLLLLPLPCHVAQAEVITAAPEPTGCPALPRPTALN